VNKLDPLDKLVRQYGPGRVKEALSAYQAFLRAKARYPSEERSRSVSTDQAFFSRFHSYDRSETRFEPKLNLDPVGTRIIDELFRKDDLLAELRLLRDEIERSGVSEPATVPHQTPEAGVTPKGGENGKS